MCAYRPSSVPIREAMWRMHLHVRTCARADVPLFSVSREIWCVIRGPLAMRFKLLRVELIVHTCARAHHFSHLRDRRTFCSKIWCAVRHALSARFAQDGGHLHERTCSCTHILSTSIHSVSFISQKASYWFDKDEGRLSNTVTCVYWRSDMCQDS